MRVREKVESAKRRRASLSSPSSAPILHYSSSLPGRHQEKGNCGSAARRRRREEKSGTPAMAAAHTHTQTHDATAAHEAGISRFRANIYIKFLFSPLAELKAEIRSPAPLHDSRRLVPVICFLLDFPAGTAPLVYPPTFLFLFLCTSETRIND